MKELVVTCKKDGKYGIDSGHRCVVDDDIYDLIEYVKLSKNNKHGANTLRINLDSDGYPRITSHGKTIKIHNLVMGCCLNGLVVNHINRNTLDNRRVNLEIVTLAHNTRNQIKHKGKSKYRNVWFRKDRGTWYANIKTVEGKNISISGGHSEEMAARIADQLKREHLPPDMWYNFNFPEEM